MIGLLVPLLLQGTGLDITTSVDRSRVGVGEVVTYTLRAIGRSTAAFRAELPPLDGFAIVERRERTDIVPAQREIIRAYTMELELRAEQVGTWTIGAVRIEQGASTAFSNAETVTVTSASALSTGLESDLLALIGSVPSPRYGVPSVFVVPSARELYAGDQLNVLTAAWLPRGLRLRLRQPPTLSPPALPGVWSTPRTSVPGAVASRSLEGELYDLFVGFQTVYPLNPGVVTIPAARLSWTEPGGRQISGDDRRRVTESGEVRIVVNALPDAGRPASFAGPVGRGVRIEYRLGQGAGRAGVVLPVEIVLSGTGNLALWPTPQVAWPAAARVYEEESEITPRLIAQRVGGTRRFRFTVVPDSAGSLPLPPLEYAYFDPGISRYQIARATGIVVPVLEPLPVSDRRSPVPLWLSRERSPVETVLGLDRLLLAAIGLVPLLVIAVTALIRGRKPKPAPVAAAPDPAAQLQMLVHGLVPRRSFAEMEAELRRAGLDRGQAEQVARLHRAVEAEVYSQSGKGKPGAELVREIEGAIRALPPGVRRAGGLALLLLALGTELHGQPAMTLYARREYAAAAEAFRREPESPRRWYNIAASEYMARRDAHAVAALLAARATAPRDARVRGLWAALAREHEQLRRTERITPLSAGEAYVAALILLWIGAILFVVLPRRRMPAAVVLLLAMAAGGGGWLIQRDRGLARGVLAGGASLRVSPHGLAPERGTAPAFSIVRLERRAGPWWLVATDAGARGWVPEEILAAAPR